MHYRRVFVSVAASALLAVACSGATRAPSTGVTGAPAGNLTADLLGAGASFPAPIYLEWIAEYTANVQPGMSINYQSIGSGGGVEQFIGQQTDFGASDAFLRDAELADATSARGCSLHTLRYRSPSSAYKRSRPDTSNRQ